MRRRLPSTWLGPKGSSELHPKGASKPTPVRRLLIQLLNNLCRETCSGEREASKKRVAARASTWALRGAQPHSPLDSASCLIAYNRRFHAAGCTRPQPASLKKRFLNLRLPPQVAMVR